MTPVTQEDLEANPFAATFAFLINYSDDANIVEEETMNNIKTLLKDFLKQQSELATVKENYYVLKNGLSDVIKSNQDYIGDENISLDVAVEEEPEIITDIIRKTFNLFVEKIETNGCSNSFSNDGSDGESLGILRIELREKDRLLNELLEKFSDLQTEKLDIEAFAKTLDSKLENVNKIIFEKDKAIKELANRNIADSSRTDHEMIVLQNEVKHFKSQLDQANEQLLKYKSNSTSNISSLNDELDILRRESLDLKIELEESQKKVQYLTSENSFKSKTIAELQTREFMLSDENSSLKEELEELKKQVQLEIDELTESLNQEKMINNELRNEIGDLGHLSAHRGMNSLSDELNDIGNDKKGNKTSRTTAPKEHSPPANNPISPTKPKELNGHNRKSATNPTSSQEDFYKVMSLHLLGKIKEVKDKKPTEVPRPKSPENSSKKLKEYEGGLQSLSTIVTGLQKKLADLKKENKLLKKQLELKEKLITKMSDKLMSSAVSYSEMINDLNSQVSILSIERDSFKNKLEVSSGKSNIVMSIGSSLTSVFTRKK